MHSDQEISRAAGRDGEEAQFGVKEPWLQSFTEIVGEVLGKKCKCVIIFILFVAQLHYWLLVGRLSTTI